MIGFVFNKTIKLCYFTIYHGIHRLINHQQKLFILYIFTTFPKRICKSFIFASVIKTHAVWELSSSSITSSLSSSFWLSTRRGGHGSSMSAVLCSGSWFGHYLAEAWAQEQPTSKKTKSLEK